MRIALVIYDRLDILTGGYIYDRLLVEYLWRRGHRVFLISIRKKRYALNLLDNFSDGVASRVNRYRPDILLEDGMCHPSLLLINRKLRSDFMLPVVGIIHQLSGICNRAKGGGSLVRKLEACYLNSIDAAIFNSRTTRDAASRITGRTGRSIVAYPAGDRFEGLASASLIPGRAHKDGPLELICVGNVLPGKKVDTMIFALARVNREFWYLRIVGDLDMNRRYTNRIARMIRRLGLDDRIELTGALRGPTLADCYEKSHLLVMPYSVESYGMAYIEAMGYGLPAVGSTAGACREIIRHGVNGYLVSPGDTQNFARIIINFYHDREDLTVKSLAAWATFRQHPKWNDSLEAIESLLSGLVSKSP